MTIPVARLGDPSDHGGVIISPNQTVNTVDGGHLIAVTGAQHSCPIEGHGITSITGSGVPTIEGKQMVRGGDHAGCGAAITSGSPTYTSG